MKLEETSYLEIKVFINNSFKSIVKSIEENEFLQQGPDSYRNRKDGFADCNIFSSVLRKEKKDIMPKMNTVIMM